VPKLKKGGVGKGTTEEHTLNVDMMELEGCGVDRAKVNVERRCQASKDDFKRGCCVSKN